VDPIEKVFMAVIALVYTNAGMTIFNSIRHKDHPCLATPHVLKISTRETNRRVCLMPLAGLIVED